MTAPACMDDTEYSSWSERNAAIPKPEWRASTPCLDCPHWFAEEQYAMGTCDGTPGRAKRAGSLPWASRTNEYKRQKAQDYRRRRGAVDIEAKTLERVQQAAQMRQKGLKVVEIARHMGVKRQTVTQYLKRAAS